MHNHVTAIIRRNTEHGERVGREPDIGRCLLCPADGTRNVAGRLAPGIGRLFFIDGLPLHLGNSIALCRSVMLPKFPRPTGFRLTGWWEALAQSAALRPFVIRYGTSRRSGEGCPPWPLSSSRTVPIGIFRGISVRSIRFPCVSAEEEFGLARRSRDHRDVNAAHGLVTSRLRLVAKIAAGCRGHGQRFGELIGDSNMGDDTDGTGGSIPIADSASLLRPCAGSCRCRPRSRRSVDAGRDGEWRDLPATRRRARRRPLRNARTDGRRPGYPARPNRFPVQRMRGGS